MERSTNDVGAYGNGEAIEKIRQEINGAIGTRCGPKSAGISFLRSICLFCL